MKGERDRSESPKTPNVDNIGPKLFKSNNQAKVVTSKKASSRSMYVGKMEHGALASIRREQRT